MTPNLGKRKDKQLKGKKQKCPQCDFVVSEWSVKGHRTKQSLATHTWRKHPTLKEKKEESDKRVKEAIVKTVEKIRRGVTYRRNIRHNFDFEDVEMVLNELLKEK